MAQRSEDQSDKALWLTLAQSWVRLADHVERSSKEQSDDALNDPEVAEAVLADSE